jgi:hypothetical protein
MAAPETGTERTVGQLFASATADLTALVHDEITLAKQEIKKDVKRGLAGSGSAVVAGVVALASVPVLSIAAALGIHALGPTLGWSFLIVGGAYLLLAAILGFVAFRFFKKLSPPERTIASTKATVDVLKGAKPHPAPESITQDGHRALTR